MIYIDLADVHTHLYLYIFICIYSLSVVRFNPSAKVDAHNLMTLII